MEGETDEDTAAAAPAAPVAPAAPAAPDRSLSSPLRSVDP